MALRSRQVIALVLARGGIDEFPAYHQLKYKALLPLAGRPLAAYIVQALQGSAAETIFVLQEREAQLEQTIAADGKTVFLSHDGPADSVAAGLVFGLEYILRFYGGQTDKMIMILPCDIPVVGSSEIDACIGQLEHMDADVVFTSIRLKALGGLKQRLTVYSPDLGEQTATQNINFISGRRLSLDAQGKLQISDDEDQPITGIDQALDTMRHHRRSPLLWPRLIYQFYIFRMLKHGHALQMLDSLIRLATRRLNLDSLKRTYYAALKVKVDFLVSTYPSFSFDVDNTSDLARVEQKLPSVGTSPEDIIGK